MGAETVRDGVMDRLTELATTDDAFRSELLADPKGALSKMFGGHLPEDLNVEVHEETPGTIHIVIPAKPALAEEVAAPETTYCNQGGGQSWSSCGYELSCYGPTCSSN